MAGDRTSDLGICAPLRILRRSILGLAVPIVGVCITSGTAPYDFAAALHFMTHLDTLLDVDTIQQLAALDIDTSDAAFKLANTLPHIISVALVDCRRSNAGPLHRHS